MYVLSDDGSWGYSMACQNHFSVLEISTKEVLQEVGRCEGFALLFMVLKARLPRRS
jgi:hypothetical protein